MNAASEEVDEATAYHEAGHAVIGCVLDWPPVRVTIEAVGDVVGRTDFEDWPEPFTRVLNSSEASNFIENRIVGVFAAGIAQTRKFPERARDQGDTRDERQAQNYSDYLYCDQGCEEAREAALKNGRLRAVSLIEKHWRSIETVAQALIKQRTLDREQLLVMLEGSSQG